MDHRFIVNSRTLAAALVASAVGLLCSSGCGLMAHNENADGVRLYQQAAYPAAIQKFQQAVQTDPNNADSYYNLAAAYHRQGKLQQRPADLQMAERTYHQCLDHNPDHVECYRGLTVLLEEQNRSDAAFQLLEGWTQRSPTLPDPKIELARLFEETGNRAAAESHLVEALTVTPENPRALAALGKLREEQGDKAQALSNYQRSLAQNRYQPQVAARVAALQAGGINSPAATTANGTRLVANPGDVPLR